MNILLIEDLESYKYLKKNKKLYERVMHIDIDDIFIFGDILQQLERMIYLLIIIVIMNQEIY